MAQIIGALKGDAADVFYFACHHGKKHTKDLGVILEWMRHHYCGTLTFREQRNTIEKRQKTHKTAEVRVFGAVDGLAGISHEIGPPVRGIHQWGPRGV